MKTYCAPRFGVCCWAISHRRQCSFLSPTISRNIFSQRDQWPAYLTCKRNQYAEFCAEFIVDPDSLADNDGDDPLGASAGDDASKYSEYFKNKELMLEIDKDTKRTWSSMHFFAVPCQTPEVLTQKGPSRQQVQTLFFHLKPEFSFVHFRRVRISSALRARCSCLLDSTLAFDTFKE